MHVTRLGSIFNQAKGGCLWYLLGVKILVWDGFRGYAVGVVVLSSYVAGTLSPRTHHHHPTINNTRGELKRLQGRLRRVSAAR